MYIDVILVEALPPCLRYMQAPLHAICTHKVLEYTSLPKFLCLYVFGIACKDCKQHLQLKKFYLKQCFIYILAKYHNGMQTDIN